MAANKLASCAAHARNQAILHAKTNSAAAFAHNSDRPSFWPFSQLSTGLSRRFGVLAGCVALFVALAGCRAAPSSTERTGSRPTRGGELLVSVRSEPASFNRHASRDSTTNLVNLLTQARLVRVNQATQVLEPMLAESWTTSADGRRYDVKLREGLSFSDGVPFTAQDVVFSFDAAYDAKNGSVLGDTVTAGGKVLKVEATGEHAVAITFPAPFAPGIRILDSLPILPRHKLEGALQAGTLRKAWGLQTPVAEVVGLGPFVISAYQPGQRLIFARNPRYFEKAPDGTQLPYLDRLIVDVIPDQSAELLRLESAQLDMMTSDISPDAYAPLKRAADAGRVKLLDLGVSRNADGLWMNLKPGAFAGDPRGAWLQRDELRRAISMAVDRQAFADTVFLGAGVPIYGAETPANKVWYWTGTPQTPHDPAAARQLLATIGLTDRDGNGTLEDAAGHPAQFTLITQKGRASLERAATVIREEMKKIGVVVDVVTLDSSQVVQRFLAGRYDAVYYNATKTDLDPGTNQDFWLSSGSAHPWNVEQKTPATEWERQIDELMVRQIASRDEAERKRLYDEVQKIFCEHLPMVFFVAPRVYAASSARVLNVTPSDARPQLLWRPEVVAVAH